MTDHSGIDEDAAGIQAALSRRADELEAFWAEDEAYLAEMAPQVDAMLAQLPRPQRRHFRRKVEKMWAKIERMRRQRAKDLADLRRGAEIGYRADIHDEAATMLRDIFK